MLQCNVVTSVGYDCNSSSWRSYPGVLVACPRVDCVQAHRPHAQPAAPGTFIPHAHASHVWHLLCQCVLCLVLNLLRMCCRPCCYEVIVTTYNTLGTEWGGKRGRYSDTGSPLAHIKWVSRTCYSCNRTTCPGRASSPASASAVLPSPTCLLSYHRPAIGQQTGTVQRSDALAPLLCV
jgi:hypothetical protein